MGTVDESTYGDFGGNYEYSYQTNERATRQIAKSINDFYKYPTSLRIMYLEYNRNKQVLKDRLNADKQFTLSALDRFSATITLEFYNEVTEFMEEYLRKTFNIIDSGELDKDVYQPEANIMFGEFKEIIVSLGQPAPSEFEI